MQKRILSFILAWILILACFPFWAVEAQATPNTHPNTHVNTGDQRYDIIQVARTQVGYYEGTNNDTKYGAEFNINNLGWCGAFVSWCAKYAGVPDSVLSKTGVPNPSAYGLVQKPAGYIPKSGDLFFAPDYSHVGLVYYVEGDYFYSIEGNTWDHTGRHGVYIKKKLISSQVYASPNYKGGGDHKYIVDTEAAHPHKEFYKCTECGDWYYSGKTSTVADCTQCIQNACNHSYSSWSKVNDSNHSRVCSKCNIVETKSHSWNSGTVIKAAGCNTAGSKLITCTVCKTEKTQTIPKTGVHTYGVWIKLDDKLHARECTSCGKQEKVAHTVSSEWFTNEKQHWNNCSECMEQFKLADHEFGDTCDTPCKICNYVLPNGHLYDEVWKLDATGHWKACMNCEAKTEPEAHVFSADCDEQCDVCGFERKTTHTFSEEYVTDAENHWYACSVCGLRKDIQPHESDNTSREGVMQHCKVCALQLISDADHIHAYDELYQDQHSHWGMCSCGLEMPDESHTWSVQTGMCSVCGMEFVAENKSEFADLMPWILGGGGIFLFIIVTVIVVYVIRKRD